MILQCIILVLPAGDVGSRSSNCSGEGHKQFFQVARTVQTLRLRYSTVQGTTHLVLFNYSHAVFSAEHKPLRQQKFLVLMHLPTTLKRCKLHPLHHILISTYLIPLKLYQAGCSCSFDYCYITDAMTLKSWIATSVMDIHNPLRLVVFLRGRGNE